jgi:hypothetical protein
MKIERHRGAVVTRVYNGKHKKKQEGMGQTSRAQSEMGRVEIQPGRFMGWKTRFSLVTTWKAVYQRKETCSSLLVRSVPTLLPKIKPKNSLPLKHEPGFARTMKTVQIHQRRIIGGINTSFMNSDSHKNNETSADRKKRRRKRVTSI